MAALPSEDFDAVFTEMASSIDEPPFGRALQDMLAECAKCIMRIESDRGEIRRRDRSSLSDAAQPYQDLIDRLLYDMAGITPTEAEQLEERLSRML